MTRSRLAFVCATTLLSASSFLHTVYAVQPPAAPAKAGSTAAEKPQSEVASKTAKIATIAATAPAVKSALAANDLAGAKAQVGKTVAFTGTVSKVYAPKSNKLVILNFDPDYKKAMTAVVFSTTFAKFPDLTTLDGKKLLVSGKVTEFHGGYEIVVSSPTDLKIVP
jgi:DNA/RNA endonuclease YhcR with UshA esterase domain